MSAFATAFDANRSHSRDYYVRARMRTVEQVAFAHVQSDEDAGVLQDARDQFGHEPRAAGFTEWGGQIGGRHISLAWDWAADRDDRLWLIFRVRPRTNVRLICDKGYDLPLQPDTDGMLLFSLIESIPWRFAVAASLRDQTTMTALG